MRRRHPSKASLNGAANLIVSSDDRIELALFRPLGQIDGVLRKRFAVLFGIGVIHVFTSTGSLYRGLQRGGINAGTVYGETDEFGYNIVRNPVHVHDFQATLLHLLGFDHERLTFLHQGRRFRLTDVHGKVVDGLMA